MTMRVSLQMNELACEHWQEPGIKPLFSCADICSSGLTIIPACAGRFGTKKPFAAGLLTGFIGTIKKYVVTNLSANKPGRSRVKRRDFAISRAA
ncbi:TPA: hypothetical protein L9N02_005346 [Klebsiella quasipneumoniae subsp. similipneumoniae]|uniref:hypothetical protein n=1 Tax=Klebsiella quasipneumoniae TaxID=1463165 RepID=UPI0012BA13F7|nr:hypothetical protein [Klebsiella quasipneumoniae]HBR2113684.1 hypothetical protein [Klebsiella quasipneumoniae subsp. similipneumoniae]MBO3251759.1 hypothetical protein [Klebsiella quasipneumoniae]HBR2118776.1 hypothetical protein [Klebsiella quasipneumoniae subsp. similipneumoniae]HDE1088483.1 hypothetical protein [Klebsiella quasipneumoniae]HDU5832429.1 hypothetical protein [Klebsiella quasipneumoniae subsp. similipneumoniae]